MNRSTWKIPRVIKLKPRSTPLDLPNKPIKTYLRAAMIAPENIGKTIQIYNGFKFVPIRITDHLVGFKYGQFSLTKKRVFHKRKKKGK